MSNLIQSSMCELTMQFIDALFDNNSYGSYALSFNQSNNFKADFYGFGYLKNELIQHLNNGRYKSFIYSESKDKVDAYFSICDYYHYINQPLAIHPVPPVGVECPHCHFPGVQV